MSFTSGLPSSFASSLDTSSSSPSFESNPESGRSASDFPMSLIPVGGRGREDDFGGGVERFPPSQDRGLLPFERLNPWPPSQDLGLVPPLPVSGGVELVSSGGGSSSPTRLLAGISLPSSRLCWIIQTARWCSKVAPLAASSSGSRKCESKLKFGAWWGDVEGKGWAGEGGAGHEEVGA